MHLLRALILGHALDPAANAVASALLEDGAFVVERAAIEQLAAARWEHRLSARGEVSTMLRLSNGTETVPDVVFNRLSSVSTTYFDRWSGADREYGCAELSALLLSWLASLGDRVINRPMFGSLAGPVDRPWHWLARAAAAGLPLHPTGATTSTRRLAPPRDALERPEMLPAFTLPGLDRALGYAKSATELVDLLVIGETIVGGEEAGMAHEACLRLAHMTRTDVLGVRLARRPGESWRFVTATSSPAIEGAEPVAALVALLEQRALGQRTLGHP